MSSAYWRFREAKNYISSAKKYFEKKETSANAVKEFRFFTGKRKVERKHKFGYAWTANALRLKSDEDLNALWYVLQKYRNSFRSDLYIYLKSQSMPQRKLDIEKHIDSLEKSMRRLKGVAEERAAIQNETMQLFEFFHYKKHMYKKGFKSKFPNLKIEEPMYSKAELEKIEKYMTQMDHVMEYNGINEYLNNASETNPIDFVELREMLPNGFLIEDTFSLIGQLNSNSEVLKKLKDIFKKIKYFKYFAFKKPSKKEIAKNEKILEERQERYNTLKLELYEECKNYLDFCRSHIDQTYSTTKSKYTSEEAIKLLDKNREFVYTMLNTESYYIEILNNKEQEYIGEEINSKILDKDLIALIQFPVEFNKPTERKTAGLIQGSTESSEFSKVSVLSEKELKTLESLKTKTSAMNLLPMYVKNTEMLHAKSKRQLLDKIQRGRAKIAKEIFMKEMTAVSYKLRNMDESSKAKLSQKVEKELEEEQKAKKAKDKKSNPTEELKQLKEESANI